MATPDSKATTQERRRSRARFARLEADIAYFQARLEFIGDPDNTNQMAQRKVFKMLHKSIANTLMDKKRELSDPV